MIENDTTGKSSKEYGINRNSALNNLTYFHVCDGSLIPDIMHDLLEGVLQYEVKLMLQYMINLENYFTLETLNSKLQNLELSNAESKDRPTAISSKTINSDGNSLKQNGLWLLYFVISLCDFVASQMWLLGRILPLLIGQYVPEEDERWMLYLQLMDIVDILFAPATSEDYAIYLSSLISDHHNEFCRLYPESNVIPKMHFMVHMPRLMIKYVISYQILHCFIISIDLGLLFVIGQCDLRLSTHISSS